MRKYLYLLGLLLLIPAIYVYATDGVSGVEHPAKVNSVTTPDKVCGVSGLAAGGAGCPSGTYEFGYDGDHASGVKYGCYESGSANEEGSELGTPSISSSYVETNALDEGLRWTITGDISANIDNVGSAFLSFHIVDGGEGGDWDNCPIFEIAYNDNEKIIIYASDSSNMLCGAHHGGATTNNVKVTTLLTGTNYRVGYTWDAVNDVHAIRVVTSGAVDLSSPDDEDSETVDPFDDSGAVDPDTITLGEDHSGIPFDEASMRVWDVFVVSGYKATDPGSL